MAIDLPDTIPSIINTIRRSSRQSFRKSPRIRWPTLPWRRNSKHQCRCGFPGCLDCRKANRTCVNSNKNFEISNETDPDCEHPLFEVDTKCDSVVDNLTDWKLRDEDNPDSEVFANKYWKKEKKSDRKYFGKQRDDEKLLSAEDKIARRKKRACVLGCVGVVLLCVCFIIRIWDPVQALIDLNLSLAPGTFALWMFKMPPVVVYAKMYIFNVTNPKEFLQGKENLKLQELGPFVYQEILENKNVTFNDNGTVTYIPKRTVKAIPEMSVGIPKDMTVIVPNIPLLGLASMIANSSVFTNLGFLTLTKYLSSEPFLNMTIHDYFWGYQDPLVKMANRIVTNWITFANFGLLDRMYDEGDNLVTLRLQDNGLDYRDDRYAPQYSIESWNGSPGLGQWGFNDEEYQKQEKPVSMGPKDRCKYINGATEGVAFPKNPNHNITHQIYRKTFCRIMPISYDYSGKHNYGLTADYYKLPEDVFDSASSNPAQACYCNPNTTKCLPKGLSDITPCYYNIPAAVSFPHFLDGDPSLTNKLEGIKPDRTKHRTYVALQPGTGTPVEFRSRIQTNLVMRNIKYNNKLIPFSNMYLPIFWMEMVYDGLPWYIACMLYSILVVVPVLQTVFMVLGFILGVTFILYALFSFLLLSGVIQLDRRTRGRRYSAITLSPAINKAHIINLSRKNSIMTAINNSRKNSTISLQAGHRPLVNET